MRFTLTESQEEAATRHETQPRAPLRRLVHVPVEVVSVTPTAEKTDDGQDSAKTWPTWLLVAVVAALLLIVVMAAWGGVAWAKKRRAGGGRQK